MAFSFTSQVKPGQRRAGEGQEQEGKAEGRGGGQQQGGGQGRAGQGRAGQLSPRQGQGRAGKGLEFRVWGLEFKGFGSCSGFRVYAVVRQSCSGRGC